MPTTPRRSTRFGTAALVGTLAVGGGYLASTITGVAASPNPPAQVAAATEASGFVPIAAYRTYDSRTDPDESDKVFIKSERFVDAALDTDGVEQIPDEATGVTFNITITETEGAGYVQISAPGNTFGETSTVNWQSDGHTTANSGSALLFEGDVFENNLVFHVDGASGGAHVIIDITGYYVPIS